jgi:hypothetical protein
MTVWVNSQSCLEQQKMGQYLRAQTPAAYHGNSALFLAVNKAPHHKPVMMALSLAHVDVICQAKNSTLMPNNY